MASVLDQLTKLLAQRQTLIGRIVDQRLPPAFDALFIRYSAALVAFSKSRRWDISAIGSLSTTADMIRLLDKAGIGTIVSLIARDFPPIARAARQSQRVAGLSGGVDIAAINRLLTARVAGAVESSASGVVAAVKSAWIDSTFLGRPPAEAIDAAVMNNAPAAGGVARTQIGSALAVADRAAGMVGVPTSALYVYIGPQDDRTRSHCKTAEEKAWSRAQIDKLSNQQLPNVFLTCGGYNCRHHWQAISAALARQIGLPLATAADIRAFNNAALQ